MKTIQQLWTDFQKQVMHPNAPADQVKEMRIAFYAGFITMFSICEKLGHDDISEETGVIYLKQFNEEISRFKI